MVSFRNFVPDTRTTIAAASLAATAMAATAAHSADIPPRAAALPPAPLVAQFPVFTWTGFYLGVNAGWAGGARNPTSVFVTPPGTGLSDIGGGRREGFGGGLQAGYNWQVGNLVVGIETDIQALVSGNRRLGPATLPDGTIATGRGSGAWYGTLRPRVGYAFDRTLLYVTGGLAYGGGKHSIATIDGAGNTAALRSDNIRTGWALGGGAEYAFSRNWSAKLEYQYVNLGAERMTGGVFTPAGVATGATVSSRHENKFHTVKAGLNYRF